MKNINGHSLGEIRNYLQQKCTQQPVGPLLYRSCFCFFILLLFLFAAASSAAM
jgi:hypothetical protein